MGKIYNNLISTGAGFKYNAQQPLDDRAVVQSSSDLADLVDSNISYEGIEVYVVDDKKAYKLVGTEWKAIATEQYVNGAFASVDEKITNKQDTLVSGENVKTVNGETILGSGDITINVDLTSKPGEKTVDGGEIFNQYVPEYDDVYDTEGKVIGQQKVENVALSKFSTAIGRGNTAGVKAFVIQYYENGEFKLDAIDGLAQGDMFSVKALESYINIGTIQEVDSANISIKVAMNQNRDEEWAKLTAKNFGDLTEKHLFVIDKLNIGTTSFDVGQYARGFNNKAVLTGAYAEGCDNISADRYAPTAGVHNIAYYSAHAEGYQTKALGDDSHSEGIGTQALGAASHAQGRDTTAKGVASFSTGIDTTAEGHYSTAIGKGSSAIGEAAYAEGLGNIAQGAYAHAEGYLTKAIGVSSHAEGEVAEAHGKNSHVEGEGSYTNTSAINGHAEGYWTIAGHQAAHAEGRNSKALGIASHAGGTYSEVNINDGFAHGTYLKVDGVNGDCYDRPVAAFGQFNEDKANLLFMVGNGTSTTNRKNAFEVLENGTATIQATGDDDNSIATKGYVDKHDIVISGDGTWGSATISGSESIAAGNSSVALGLRNQAGLSGWDLAVPAIQDADDSQLLHLKSSAYDVRPLHVGCSVGLHHSGNLYDDIGIVESTTYTGNSYGLIDIRINDGANDIITLLTSDQTGDDCTIYTTDFSIVGPSKIGLGCLTAGIETVALGSGSVAVGNRTHAKKNYSIATGSFCKAGGATSFAGGTSSETSKGSQFAYGTHATLTGADTLPGAAAFGRYNDPNSPALFMIGNGETNRYSNAFEVFRDGHAELPALKNANNELDATAIGGSNFAVATKGYVENTLSTKLAQFPIDQTYNDKSDNPQSGKAVAQAIADMVDSAPTTLNTLNELAAALGDDPNFATTVATQIGNKQDKFAEVYYNDGDLELTTDDSLAMYTPHVYLKGTDGIELSTDESIYLNSGYNSSFVASDDGAWLYSQCSHINVCGDELTLYASENSTDASRTYSRMHISKYGLSYNVENRDALYIADDGFMMDAGGTSMRLTSRSQIELLRENEYGENGCILINDEGTNISATWSKYKYGIQCSGRSIAFYNAGTVEIDASNEIHIGGHQGGIVFITQLENPTSPTDAVHKRYVDNAINDIKNSSTKITIKVWEDED